MKIKKLLVMVVIIILLFQNICYADEIVLTGYDEYGSIIVLLLIIDAIVAAVSISLDILKKKMSIISIILICIGLILYTINSFLFLDDINNDVFEMIYIIIMIIVYSLLVYLYKKSNYKYFKIIMILALLFNILIIPIQNSLNYFTEEDIYKYSFLSETGKDFYLEIDEFNSNIMKYQGKQSYKKTKELLELLKGYYNLYMEEPKKVPIVNYIGEKSKYVIDEFDQYVQYYASRKNKIKNKNNSLYYIVNTDSNFQNEYMSYLTDIEEVLKEEKSYNIEIQEMVCQNKSVEKDGKFNIVHVVNIVEQ